MKTGEDNQITILHPARFIPGMLCAATDAWLQARDFTPKSVLILYEQYDVQNLGFSRNLSAKAWAAVHNPGHGNLSINLFATAASQAASSREQKDTEPFGDLEDFKTALRAASLAQTMVMPWNFSIAAIEGFLHSTKYGFRNQRDHIRQLTAFVDLCFTENSRRWNLRKPFLVNQDLTNKWNVFTAVLGAAPHPPSTRGSGKGGCLSVATGPSPLRPRWAEEEDSYCRRFNMGHCKFDERDCNDGRGRQPHHMCDVRVGYNGARWGKQALGKKSPAIDYA